MGKLCQLGGKLISGNSLKKSALLELSISFIIWLLILLFFGKYLWNTVLIKLVPGIKPVTSMWQILGLSILAGILVG